MEGLSNCFIFLLFIAVSNSLNSTVIDLSHHNKNVDFSKLKKSGVKGVIHKATQGITFKDPKYGRLKSEAESAGMLWGAYHFGTNHEGVAQAKHFLKIVDCGCGNQYPLLALDIEENGGNTMSLANAEAFVQHIIQETGKCPLIYGGYYLKNLVAGKSTILTTCPLWLSQYGNEPSLPDGWSNYALWQYTDGKIGPDPSPLTGAGKVDKNSYNSDRYGDLDSFWNSLGFIAGE